MPMIFRSTQSIFSGHHVTHICELLPLNTMTSFRPANQKSGFEQRISDIWLSYELVLGIGRENHYRLSEHISRLIIDCTIEMYVPLTLTSEVIKNAQYLTM